MNQRGSTLIIGVLIGAVVVAAIWGAYYLGTQKNISSNLSQSPSTQYTAPASVLPNPASSPAPSNETTDLKTYTSPRYGFSFQYPAEWVLTEAPGLVEPTETNVHLKVNNKEVLGIYAAPPPMGCGPVDESLITSSAFIIGKETITVNNFCGDKSSFHVQTLNNEGKQIGVWIQFVTTPQEEDGREVLKSITDLKVSDRQ